RAVRRSLFGTGARNLFAHLGEPQSTLVQDIGGEALLFAEQSKQQVFRTNVLVIEALCFLSAVGEHALALMRKRQIDRGRYLFPHGGVCFDLLTDGFHRSAGPQEAASQRFVLPQQTEQQMLCLNARTSELTGLVTCEEY